MTSYPDCVCCGAAGRGSCPGDQCRDCDLHCSSMSHCDRARPSPPTATEPCPRCGSSSYLGVAPMCGACVAAMAEQPAKPSPAWVWRGTTQSWAAGTCGKTEAEVFEDPDGRMRALVTFQAHSENVATFSTPLPAWSLAQCKRWVEQWVASQADAAVAAYEAAEGMR